MPQQEVKPLVAHIKTNRAETGQRDGAVYSSLPPGAQKGKEMSELGFVQRWSGWGVVDGTLISCQLHMGGSIGDADTDFIALGDVRLLVSF